MRPSFWAWMVFERITALWWHLIQKSAAQPLAGMCPVLRGKMLLVLGPAATSLLAFYSESLPLPSPLLFLLLFFNLCCYPMAAQHSHFFISFSCSNALPVPSSSLTCCTGTFPFPRQCSLPRACGIEQWTGSCRAVTAELTLWVQ